ncbi:MAG: hypothetical protein ABFS03_09440 [Chloroflexota bacterium]
MNAKFVLHRLELNFWHTAIPIMGSSPTVRYLVPRVYGFLQSKTYNEFIIPGVISAAIGLSLGFVLGILYYFII